MKNLFTKSLSVFLSMLMCFTLAPLAFAEGGTVEEPAAPKFKIELVSETKTEATVEITLTENEFKCLDFCLTGNENLKLTKISLNPDIVLTEGETGSASTNTTNGMISFARTGSFVPEFKIATYIFEKLTPAGVKADDFVAEITSCGLEGKVDVTEIAVIDMAIPAEHTHIAEGEWIETEASTCAKAGAEVRYCGICGEVAETRSTAKKDHVGTKTEHQDATCTEEGFTKVICVDCGEVLNKITIPASHGETTTDSKDATCTDAGYTKVTCTKCGEVIKETVIEAKNHANKEDEHKDPTCTEAGYDRVVCADCGEVLDETPIPATNHANKTDEHKDATCTEDGYDKVVCADCGEVIEETPIEKTGHSEETIIDRKLPTCTEDGYVRNICTVCNDIAAETVIKSSGHGYIQDLQLPTCTEDGYSREYCPSCGDSRNEYTLKKTDHSWLGWKVVTPATYAKDGVERRVCDNCGVDEERSIPKLVLKPTEIILDTQETGMNFRQKMRLFANVYPDEAAYSAEIIWESSDESVVTVNEDGEVYAAGLGTATVTAKTADGTVSATCEITVTYSTLQWIIIYILFGWIWYL